jgi:carboxypeptidase family protein/TonB-dependent receptor-like protein
MRTRVLAAAIVAVLLTWAGLPAPAAAQGVGAIGGTVSDTSGAALPGVSVTLSNPGVIGGDQQTVTDERGAYQFARLVPGATYAVRAALQGFRTALQEKVVVNSDATSRIDLHLEIGAIEETITVSGQAPLLDTTQTLKQTVMTRETLDALPSRSDVWAIARTAPAVIMNKYDVGGSEMFSQSFAQIYGSTDNERAYTIDGMDVTWAGGEGFVISYLDAHMFQEVNLQTASGSAESAKGGLITNMVTKTGSNRFTGSYNFSGGGENTSWDNLSGKTLADLLAAVPLRARLVNPDLVPSAKTLGIFDNSVSVAGPIVHDKLWFAVTESIASLAQYRVGSYNLDGSRAKDENLMRNISSKVSWQARRASQLHVLYNFNNKGQFNRTENTAPITDFIDGNATIHQVINSNIVQAKWTSVLHHDLLLDASGSLLRGDEHGRPQDAVALGSIPTFDSVRREHTVAPPNFLHRPATRANVLSSLTFHVGSHDLKAGYQLMYRKASDTWTGVISPYAPFGFRRVLRDGVPDSVNTYNSPTTFVMYSHDHAGFIQDRWTPTKKLTLNLGLRLESTYAREPALCQEQTLFIAAQCFSKIDGVPSLVMPSPRLGAIYDVAGDGKTAIKLTINRYNQPIGVNYLQLINPVRLTNDTRLWTDRNGDLVPQLDELGPSTGFNLGTTNRFAGDLKWPYAVEYSLGVQRSLPYEMVAGATYINRQRGNEIGSKNLAVPANTYIPLTVREVSSGAVVTVYDQAPSLRGKFDVLYGNYSEMDTDFNGVDITLNKRLSHRWMMMASASFGKSKGDIYGSSFDLNDPNNSFRRGLIGNDVPFSFKAFGLYQLPYGISFSGTAQHFSGTPELTTVLVSSNTGALTRVSQRVTFEPRGTTRLPDVNMIDFSLRKTFTSGRYSLEPIMDMFNVTNGSAIRARSTQLGPTYGVASDVVRGRIIKFGLNVKF